MYRGLFLTDTKRIVKERDTFAALIKEMDILRNECKGQNIQSIDIYEDENSICFASLRIV